MRDLTQEQVDAFKDSEADLATIRKALNTIRNGAKGDISVDPHAQFDHKVGLLVKEKQKLGWNSRRIRRYVKTNFNLTINIQ